MDEQWRRTPCGHGTDARNRFEIPRAATIETTGTPVKFEPTPDRRADAGHERPGRRRGGPRIDANEAGGGRRSSGGTVDRGRGIPKRQPHQGRQPGHGHETKGGFGVFQSLSIDTHRITHSSDPNHPRIAALVAPRAEPRVRAVGGDAVASRPGERTPDAAFRPLRRFRIPTRRRDPASRCRCGPTSRSPRRRASTAPSESPSRPRRPDVPASTPRPNAPRPPRDSGRVRRTRRGAADVHRRKSDPGNRSGS